MTNNVREAIAEISKLRIQCSLYASIPKRFKITVGTADLQFNHIVAVDDIYISNRPIKNVLDEATNYDAAIFSEKRKFRVSMEVSVQILDTCIPRITGVFMNRPGIAV